MLVLTRRIGERIVVGDNVEIEVVDVRGGKVRIGIVAPAEMPVHRKEVWVACQDEQVDASEQDGSAKQNLRRSV